ncbi:protein transport protein YIF1 [Nematocida sp. AWRm78]|nr:protein transport protein YIF1 [Nematocida sp. AWRm79]KAI5182915.1 protein transport protein YIF1 [Nematocida sp. AWRm78]
MSHSLQIDMQKHALTLGSSYINRAVSLSRFEYVRRYFQIDNSYLLRKLFLIVYPYSGEQWQCTTDRDVCGVSISDPDMYIPVMAIITYILFVACEMEVQGKFSPETLGKISTKSLFLGLLESAIIKAASFFFDCTSLSISDIIAFIGYKYVTIIYTKILSKVFPIILSKLSSLLLIASFSLFLGRSLKHFLISNEHEILIKKRKMYFLFFIVLIEGLLLVFLK